MKSPVASFLPLPLLLLSLPATAAASSSSSSSSIYLSKDDSYYKAGSGNPNVYQSMYWKDSSNILSDLGQFDYLYVEFQHCAWTWMNYGSDEEGGSVDENDYWYQGSVPPMGANVAFSLYGALKGQSFSGCNKNTFINSFYTNAGFEDFIYAMKYAGVSNFKYNYNGGYSSQCSGYSGVGCDYNNGFAVHSYSSQECNPKNFQKVTDTASSLNKAMNSAQCVKIFDRRNGGTWNGYNYTIEGTPVQLLQSSSACFYQNFWAPDGQCPDPYGKIAFYQQNFNRGLTKSKRADPFEQYTLQMEDSKRLAKLGSTLLIGAAIVLLIGCLWPTAAPVVRKAKAKVDTFVRNRTACGDEKQMEMDTLEYQATLGRAPSNKAAPRSADDVDMLASGRRSTTEQDDTSMSLAADDSVTVGVSPIEAKEPKKKGMGRFFKK